MKNILAVILVLLFLVGCATVDIETTQEEVAEEDNEKEVEEGESEDVANSNKDQEGEK